MATVTLSELRTLVRQRADMETSQFIKDPELNGYINRSIAELYDILTQKYGNDYFAVSIIHTLNSGELSHPLPTNFFKLLGVDMQKDQNTWSTLKRFEFNERNRQSNSLLRNQFGDPYVRYRITGNSIYFDVAPDANTTIRIWYVPLPITLALDTDTFDGYNGWEEYVVVDAAIKCLEKEESDTGPLMMRKQMLEQRIESAAGNRDAGFSPRIADTRAIDFEAFDNTRWF